jgi:ribosomal protein L37AE/L43A
MPKKISKIIADFPQFSFIKDQKSLWLAPKNTIFYNDDAAELLHEIAHALLGHSDFTTDVSLIKKERAAWSKALKLAEEYGVKISETKIEKDLDSYRDWLHFRSTCPKCSQNGVQNAETLNYQCFACRTRWKAGRNQHKRVYRKIV